jgi:hypothetical protein
VRPTAIISSLADSVERNAHGLGGSFQPVIVGCQRQATPHGQLQIRGVIYR